MAEHSLDDLIALGEAALDREDYPDVVRYYQAALEHEPEDTDFLFNLALGFVHLGQDKEALAHLTECLRLDPEYTSAWYTLGKLRGRRRDYGGAVLAYEEALRCDPDEVDSINNLARTLRLMGRFDEAEAMARRGLALAPDDVELNYNMGLLLSDDDLSAAIAHFRRSVEKDPGYVEAWEWLADLYAQQGRHDQALAARTRAEEWHPH